MITVACALWTANNESLPGSRCYDESWVDKLYRGFKANLTRPFEFTCWTDMPRQFDRGVSQAWIKGAPGYASLMQPFRLNRAMILVGLDTIIVGNCDHLADYCLKAEKVAVPRDPFYPETVCNGVVLVPEGHRGELYDEFDGGNDMEWFRKLYAKERVNVIDDLWPGQVVSFKGDIAKNGLSEDTRIVYFHGKYKPHELGHIGWIKRAWHDEAVAA